MNTDTVLITAQDLLAEWSSGIIFPEAHRLDMKIEANDLLSAVKTLDAAHWGYLAAITGLDLGSQVGHLEVLYHFCAGAAVLTLRVSVPHDQSILPSITSVVPAASFYERELREMMGIKMIGLSDSDPLFLPDDWPAGVYPLRKDVKLE